jgi:hypothetical protein
MNPRMQYLGDMTETTTYTERQLEDWASIFGACAGTWSWWDTIEHMTGDWDTPGEVFLAIEDPNSEGYKLVSRTFTADEIFAALRKATRLYPHLFRRFDGWLDLDAASADVVLQVAVLGEAVYG